ncbi:MAG TPA: type II toxin-antitoxin system PemK/MazF family toxin [Phycisphaerae bacterium]|nr:type II toxin-antitoxin system PemK/MazF family toxin [Phycisphaerae bacterium]
MPDLHQGEIWWADLPAPAGRRPVLVLTRTDAVGHMTNVTVAPLTRTIRGIDSEVVLSPDQGVPTVCAVSLDNIMTVRKTVLSRRIVALPADTMTEVFDAVRFVFAMP